MRKNFKLVYIFYLLLFLFTANSYLLISRDLKILFLAAPLFIFINMFSGLKSLKTKNKRLKICFHGTLMLSVFVLSMLFSLIYHIVLAFYTIPNEHWLLIWSIVLCAAMHTVLFWNGIICVYMTSVQLGH